MTVRTPTGRAGAAVIAVVPIKPLELAKTRLDLPTEQRRALALAFALDTVEAVAGSALVAGVLVVTADRVVSDRLRSARVRVVADEVSGLGPAIALGLRVARSWRPAGGVAVVPADLPCLRSDDVTQVLTAGLAAGSAYVPDRSGSGTTLVVHAPGFPPLTRYGPDSAAHHRDLGLHPLAGSPARSRHDVDTLADLRQAEALGLGVCTATVVAALDLRQALTHPVSGRDRRADPSRRR